MWKLNLNAAWHEAFQNTPLTDCFVVHFLLWNPVQESQARIFARISDYRIQAVWKQPAPTHSISLLPDNLQLLPALHPVSFTVIKSSWLQWHLLLCESVKSSNILASLKVSCKDDNDN